MKIIIFAGGTGKRFWPVSRIKSPKQFLPIVNNKPLVRLKYEYLIKGFIPEDIFISTGVQFKNEVKSMLPELPEENFIFESSMRDTGPAVTLAIAYVASKFPGEIISTQWSDHLINNPIVFIKALKESENYVNKNEDTGAVLVAVPARFPSPHRGYIQYGDVVKNFNKALSLRNFQSFKEKPSLKVAQKYIKSGNYGWNPGYWNLKPEYYFNKISKTAPEMLEVCREVVESNFSESSLKKFEKLEKISADYIFAEEIKPSEAKVILTDMGWSDVGEWIAFKEALQESEDSNLVKGKSFDLDSKDTLIYNTQEDKLIATIGLNGMVIVNTPDVMAVFHKDDNTKIKEFIKKMEENGLENYL